jgi:hypothetical protein
MNKFFVIGVLLLTLGCGNKSDNSPATANGNVQLTDQQALESDLQQIESLNDRSFGEVVTGISNMVEARTLTPQNLAPFLDENFDVRCDQTCHFSRKDRYPDRSPDRYPRRHR